MSTSRSAVPGPENDWDDFRPERETKLAQRNHSRRRLPIVLALVTVVLMGAVAILWLRPYLRGTVADISNTIRAFSQPEVPPRTKKSRQVQSVIRHPNRFRRGSGASRDRVAELGPFDAYVLDGDRYIRVEGMTKYALLDTRTGEIIWIEEPR